MAAEYPHVLSQNRLEDAENTYFRDGSNNNLTEHSTYLLDYLTDRSRGSMWQGDSSASEQRVIWDLGEALECDTMVLDKNFTLTGGKLYLDHATSLGGTYTNVVTITALTSTLVYWRTFTAVSKQFWRLRLTTLSAPPPKIFNFWVGKRIEFSDFGSYGDFDPWEEEKTGDAVRGASGGFAWNHRFARRVIRTDFRNLTDTQWAKIKSWWDQALDDGKNWWWVTFPTTQADSPNTVAYHPIYCNDEGGALKFPLGTTRSGGVTGYEVL